MLISHPCTLEAVPRCDFVLITEIWPISLPIAGPIHV
jgi:hypothetical protein